MRRITALAVAGVALLAGCGGAERAPNGLDTLEPGKLQVAVQSYTPYTAVKGEQLVGLDGEIITAVADRLGLEVEAELTDFNGMLGGVQSHRVDITVGGVAWTKERQDQGLFTDPPYYSPPAMGVRSGKTLRDRRRPAGPAARHGHGLRLGRSRSRPCPAPSSAPTRTRNGVFDDLGVRPARRRLPRPAAHHRLRRRQRPDAEDRDAVPHAADRRAGRRRTPSTSSSART